MRMTAVARPFRALYREDAPLRVLDVLAHALLALLLPGPFWAQYLPDLAVAVIFVRSWRLDAMLPEDDVWLRVHRALHLGRGSGWPMLPVAATLAIVVYAYPAAALHVLAHLSVDAVTHGKDWP